MTARSIAKKEAFTALKKALGKTFSLTAEMIVAPPKPGFGDLSFPCFALAKGMGRNPAEIATELAAKIGPSSMIKKITSAGPYVNFTFDNEAFSAAVLSDVAKTKKKYGRGKTGAGKKVLIEYANLNTHKEVHVGHLRNFSIGAAVANILSANGYAVTPVSYINDLGSNVAKCLWGIKKFHDGEEPDAADRLNFMGSIYTEATAAMEGSDDAKAEVSVIQHDLESGEGEWFALWKKTHKWSMDGLKAVFDEFGLTLDHIYLEHDLIDETHEIVKKLLTEGIAKMSQGAVIVDLEAEKLGVNLLRKTDGTLLYNAKDLALAFHKEADFHADRSLYVIDVRQALAMKQLAATLKKMEFPREILHVGYEFVTLPDGAMSSRKGNIVRWSDLRDAMYGRLVDTTTLRHPEWKPKLIAANATALVMAAVKFVMLRHDPERLMVFDMEEAMATDGFTGPYILYTIARINSLHEKTKLSSFALASALTDPQEIQMLRKIAEYPDVLQEAGADMRPSLICQYAFELAQMFSRYYAEVHIIDEEQPSLTAARLGFADVVGSVLANAMEILNIPVVKTM